MRCRKQGKQPGRTGPADPSGALSLRMLAEEFARRGELDLQRVQEARFGGGCAIGVAGAEFFELRRVPRKGGVIEWQGEAGARPPLRRVPHAGASGNDTRLM